MIYYQSRRDIPFADQGSAKFESNSNLSLSQSEGEPEKLAKAGVLVERRSSRETVFRSKRVCQAFLNLKFSRLVLHGFFFASLLMLVVRPRDELIDDEYLVFFSIHDNKRKLSDYLQKAGECNLTLSGSTADEFYENVTEYYT